MTVVINCMRLPVTVVINCVGLLIINYVRL